MISNPANLRWQYLLEAIAMDSADAKKQAKISKCLGSLAKYPLVIHDVSHFLLLRHFDEPIVEEMKIRLGQEEDMVAEAVAPDLSPIPVRRANDVDELEERRRLQEEQDLELAMKLSQEFEEEDSLPREFAKPSTAFKAMPDVKYDDVFPDIKPPGAKVHDVSLSDNEDVENRASNQAEAIVISSDDEAKVGGQKYTKLSSNKSTLGDIIGNMLGEKKLAGEAVHLLAKDVEEDDPFSAGPSRKKAARKVAHKASRSSTPKETREKPGYCPKPGSGGHAILLALLDNERSNGPGGHMTKDDLCTAAQQYADESMTQAEPGAGHFYSGWSSSSGLVKKNLIEKWSRPPKVRLTDEGRRLAEKLVDRRDQASRSNSQKFDSASWLGDVPEVVVPDRFEYCYVTDTRTETDDQNAAEVDICEYVCYLVKARKVELEKSKKRFRLKCELSGGICLAYIHESDCEEKSPVASISIPAKNHPDPASSPKKPPKKRQVKKRASSPVEQPAVEFLSRGVPKSWIIDELIPQTFDKSSVSGRPDFELKAGRYEIVLLVDVMEVTGGSAGGKKSRKNVTPEELEKLQVRYETRKLNIGDFVWVAREKGGMGRELVLPYIVERKRMDDLRSSIKDGRYKEQKQRMSHCGIRNKIYLVEEIGNYNEVESRPGDQQNFSHAIDRNVLDQAMSNTSIRDNFHIRITKSQRESMRYLTSMTEVLQGKYAGINLRQCPISEVNSRGENDLVKFDEFNEFSRPGKPLTVREIFANMLVCQKGLSAGMAWAITAKYPTLATLKQAYLATNSDEEREKMVAGILYDNGKKIPLAVSRTLCWLFNDKDLA